MKYEKASFARLEVVVTRHTAEVEWEDMVRGTVVGGIPGLPLRGEFGALNGLIAMEDEKFNDRNSCRCKNDESNQKIKADLPGLPVCWWTLCSLHCCAAAFCVISLNSVAGIYMTSFKSNWKTGNWRRICLFCEIGYF